MLRSKNKPPHLKMWFCASHWLDGVLKINLFTLLYFHATDVPWGVFGSFFKSNGSKTSLKLSFVCETMCVGKKKKKDATHVWRSALLSTHMILRRFPGWVVFVGRQRLKEERTTVPGCQGISFGYGRQFLKDSLRLTQQGASFNLHGDTKPNPTLICLTLNIHIIERTSKCIWWNIANRLRN